MEEERGKGEREGGREGRKEKCGGEEVKSDGGRYVGRWVGREGGKEKKRRNRNRYGPKEICLETNKKLTHGSTYAEYFVKQIKWSFDH